jgi:hypothetical protein
VEGGWKTGTAYNDHNETMEVMLRSGDCFIDGPLVRWRRGGHGLGMSVPITDKMETLPVHLINLSLLVGATGQIQKSRAAICTARACDCGDPHLSFTKGGEQLTSRFERLMVVLLMLGEVVQN